MTKLEKAKKNLEFKKVEVAKEEMEFRIMEKNEEISRLNDNIKIQEEKLLSLREELAS